MLFGQFRVNASPIRKVLVFHLHMSQIIEPAKLLGPLL